MKKLSPMLTKIKQVGAIIEHIHKGKMYNILVLACCIMRCRSCNLNYCKVEHNIVTGKQTKASTVYGCFKRIFQTGKGAAIQKTVFVCIIHLIYPYIEPYLVVDRTEFTIGKRWVNLLVYGVVCKGVLIPLVWKDLGKRKSSSQKERLELLDVLLAWWKATKLPLLTLSLLGDREFIGQHWLYALERRGLMFVIRLKGNLKFTVWYKGQIKERKIKVKAIGRYMRKKKLPFMELVIEGCFIVQFVSVLNDDPNAKANDKEIFLITNLDDPTQAVKLYRVRWSIECCFKHLKSNGFNLEQTALEGAHKLDVLFSILAFTYVLAIKEGILNDYENQIEERTFKKTSKTYREKSLFLFGFELLKPKVDNLKLLLRYVKLTLEDCIQSFLHLNFYYK